MRPLRDFILIEKIKEEKTKSGLILPKDIGNGPLCSGVVTDIGPQIDPASENISVGSKVFFLQEVELGDNVNENIVHISKVLAVDDEIGKEKEFVSPIRKLNWKDFKTDSYESFWKELTNFGSFTFRIDYMKPFVKIINFQKTVYEAIVQNITLPLIGPNVSVELAGDKDKDELLFNIQDDIYGGLIGIDNDSISLQFKKNDLQAIIEKLPYYLSAINSISTMPSFNSVFGKEFNRVSKTTFHIEQVIKIVGKGRNAIDPVNNKEIMQSLVNLGKAYNSSASVIDGLSPIANSIGRLDLNFSIERQIAGHQYTIFINLKAPTNQDSSYLWADVDIQDHAPGHISQRDYTPILSEFLRDTYFETFLKDLFGEIYCTTLGSK